jgi:hypothetical protein
MSRIQEMELATFPQSKHDAEVIGHIVYDTIVIRPIAGQNYGYIPQRHQLFTDDTKKVLCNSKFPVVSGRMFVAEYGRVDSILSIAGKNQQMVFEQNAKITYKANDTDYGFIPLNDLLPYQRVNVAGVREFAGQNTLSAAAPQLADYTAISAIAAPAAGETAKSAATGDVYIFDGTYWVKINMSYLDTNTALPRQAGWFTLPNQFSISSASVFEMNFEAGGTFLTEPIESNPAYFGPGVLGTDDLPCMYIKVAFKGNLYRIKNV